MASSQARNQGQRGPGVSLRARDDSVANGDTRRRVCSRSACARAAGSSSSPRTRTSSLVRSRSRRDASRRGAASTPRKRARPSSHRPASRCARRRARARWRRRQPAEHGPLLRTRILALQRRRGLAGRTAERGQGLAPDPAMRGRLPGQHQAEGVAQPPQSDAAGAMSRARARAAHRRHRATRRRHRPRARATAAAPAPVRRRRRVAPRSEPASAVKLEAQRLQLAALSRRHRSGQAQQQAEPGRHRFAQDRATPRAQVAPGAFVDQQQVEAAQRRRIEGQRAIAQRPCRRRG